METIVGRCTSSEQGPPWICHLGNPLGNLLGDFHFLPLCVRHAPAIIPESCPFCLENISTEAIIGEHCLDQVIVVCGRTIPSQAADGVGLN